LKYVVPLALLFFVLALLVGVNGFRERAAEPGGSTIDPSPISAAAIAPERVPVPAT
jgi:hypothetical protein